MSTPGNSINETTTGVVGFTSTSFTATPLTQYLVNLGHANSYQIDQVVGTGTAAQVLTSNGAGAKPTWQDASGGGISTSDITSKMIEWDDFIPTAIASQSVKLGWTATNVLSNDNSAATFTPEAGHPGIFVFETNAVEAAVAHLLTGGQTFVVGGGTLTITYVAKSSHVSDGTDNFTVTMGLGNSNSATQTNGIYFFYNHATNSGNWTINTTASSSTTTGNTSSAFDTDWHKYQIVVNAAGTSVSFFIDGSEVANSPLASNIPSAGISPILRVNRTAGTNLRYFYMDLFVVEYEFTTPR